MAWSWNHQTEVPRMYMYKYIKTMHKMFALKKSGLSDMHPFRKVYVVYIHVISLFIWILIDHYDLCVLSKVTLFIYEGF